MPTVEFESLSTANEFRERYDDHRCPDDDKRYKRVVFKSGTPEDVIEEAERAADEERGEAEAGSGQVDLSKAERGRFDFTKDGVNYGKLASVKAIALDNGVDDWTSYFDPTLSVDEHRPIYERQETKSGGKRMDAEDSAEERAGDASKRAQSEECNHAEGHCKRANIEACEFLEEECGFDPDLVDKIMADEAEGDELPGPVLGALKQLWQGYRGGISNAKKAAAGINEIRAQNGQEPISFEELGDRAITQADLDGDGGDRPRRSLPSPSMAEATHRNPKDLTPEEKAETLREAAEILETEGGGQMDLFGNEKQASGQARLAGGETGEVETEIDRETNQGGIMADTRSEVSGGATETRQRHLSGSPEDADQDTLGGDNSGK